MSDRDLNDPRVEEIVRELRATAPPAPDALRQQVLSVAALEQQPKPRRRWLRRPAYRFAYRRVLAVAAAAFVVLTVGAAVIRGLADDPERTARGDELAPVGPTASSEAAKKKKSAARLNIPQALTADSTVLSRAAIYGPFSALPPSTRLQDYNARMRLRVEDARALDRATKRAMRDTRRLGGFVSAVNFATRPDAEGDATLVLRPPVNRIQDAIARYSNLGTILSQRVSIGDLQPQADRLARSIAQQRRRINQLVEKRKRVGLTVEEQFELQDARRALRALTGQRSALVREARFATVRLELTTRTAAAKDVTPGRFDRFFDDAGAILQWELIGVLYALVVAGPFMLLAALGLLGERTRRRRANEQLLERS
jgi:hypothetical protein